MARGAKFIDDMILEAVDQAEARAILRLLRKRFTKVPGDIETALRKIADQEKLDVLLDATVDCQNLRQFQELLARLAS